MHIRVALATGAILALALAQAPPPAGTLSTEIDRARTTLLADAPEAERGSPLARLDRAKTALDAGRLYLATYLAEAGWEGATNWAFIKASSDITTQEAFVKKWTATGEPRSSSRAAPVRVPVLIEALAAVAEARGPSTYHAARPYSEDAGLFGGLYYLSDAHAVMQYAALIRGWEWPPAGTPPPLRSIADEIAAFDTEMTTAYEKMERANHSTYIVASAALKQARTLDDGAQHGGALLEYLLARYLFAPLRGPASGDATTERIAEARKALGTAADHSIAELFLQLAEEALAGGSDAQRRNAAAILEDVIPAYRGAIAPAASTTTSASASQVTITLVRWPFT